LRFTLRGARVAGLVSSPEATTPPWVFLFSRAALRRRRPDFVSVEVALRPCIPELARKSTASRFLSRLASAPPQPNSCARVSAFRVPSPRAAARVLFVLGRVGAAGSSSVFPLSHAPGLCRNRAPCAATARVQSSRFAAIFDRSSAPSVS
jgi:hypothetical protein